MRWPWQKRRRDRRLTAPELLLIETSRTQMNWGTVLTIIRNDTNDEIWPEIKAHFLERAARERGA